MMAAKLFATLALVFAIFEGFARVAALPAVSVPLRPNYYVFGPNLVLLLSLVTSANFAVLYYSGERIFRAHWNRRLTFLHFGLFVCFAISLLIMSGISARAGVGGEPREWMGWALVCMLLGFFSLIASLAVFGINLTLTVIQIVRIRFAKQ